MLVNNLSHKGLISIGELLKLLLSQHLSMKVITWEFQDKMSWEEPSLIVTLTSSIKTRMVLTCLLTKWFLQKAKPETLLPQTLTCLNMLSSVSNTDMHKLTLTRSFYGRPNSEISLMELKSWSIPTSLQEKQNGMFLVDLSCSSPTDMMELDLNTPLQE